MIAICDHNAVGDVEAAQQAAGDTIAVLAGMEITTAEEVHVVGLFADVVTARAASRPVRAALPDVRAGRGASPVSGTTTLDLDETVRLIHAHGGLAIAAHVDRPSFSVISQLGLLPTGVDFDAVEMSAAGSAAGRYPAVAALGLPVITASDSHCLEEVGGARTWFRLGGTSLDELALALRGVGGRRCDHA